MSISTPESQPASEMRSLVRRPPRAVGLVLLVAALLAVAAGAWRWTHPEAIMSGAGARHMLTPVPLRNTPLYVGFAHDGTGSPETITLQSVRVHLRDNTAGATAAVSVCTRRPVAKGTVALGDAFASYTPDLGEYCTRLRPVRPGVTLRLDDGREYLIATISPSRPGRAVFATTDVTYRRDARHLWQRGTQHLEVDTTVTLRVSS